MPTSKPTLQAYLHLHFLVIIWGFTAILGLLIDSVSPLVLTAYRTSLAWLGLGAVLWLTQKPWAVANTDQKRLFGVGILLGLHWLAFFASARVANASVCLAGMSTTSLWTALLAPVFTKQRIRPLEVGLSLVVTLGLYVIFRFEFDHAWGLALAVVSALLAALFTIANSGFVKKYDALTITFHEMIGAATVSWAGVFMYDIFAPKPQSLLPIFKDWPWILCLVFVCTVYAYSAGVRLLRQIPPFTFNLTVNLEPVYGIVLAYLVFGERERMTTGFYAGTLIILAAVLAYPLLTRRSN